MTARAGGRLPLRDELRGQAPYGAPQLEVPVRLNTNENPYEPPEVVVDAIAAQVSAAARTLNRYPDRDATRLRMRLAEYAQQAAGPDVTVAPTMVWAANGSNEILAQLLQAFGGPGRVALGFEPTYSMHRMIARGTGTDYRVQSRDGDFRIDPVAAARDIRRTRPDVVFVCSPNNPTGTSAPLEVIEGIYEAVAAGPEGIVVVDEAYSEFSSAPSAVNLLAGRPRLIVSRTMSKAFAFAGARVGYLVADPGVVDAMQLVRLPYHLSSLTQAAALAALEHSGALMVGVAELRRQRDRIVAWCGEAGVPVVASDANFVLFGGFADATDVWHRLLERGVLVRDVGLPGWLRVTAGTDEETTAFIRALADVRAVVPVKT